VRWRIVKTCHDDFGHFGHDKAIGRIQQKFWFPKMRKYVKEYISTCIQCCYYISKGGKAEGCMHYNDTDPVPFRRVHIDHLGRFVRSKRGNTHILTLHNLQWSVNSRPESSHGSYTRRFGKRRERICHRQQKPIARQYCKRAS